MKSRGAPEVVYGRDGLPLVIEVEAELDDLRRAVDARGRYRLEGVDSDLRIVEGVPVAYIQVTRPLAVAEEPAPVRAREAEEPVSVLREAMRLNTELARAVIDRFPAMLEASAVLLRAADGAGLPARLPLAVPALEVAEEENDDDEDEDEDEDDLAPEAVAAGPFGGIDLNALIAQVVPMIITKAMNGGIDLSNLGALLDWRKAVPKAKPANPAAAPAAMMHFLAIQKALSPEEAALAKEVAKGFTPAELNAWIAELSKVSIADAVARIRAITSKLAPAGSVS